MFNRIYLKIRYVIYAVANSIRILMKKMIGT